MKRNKITVMVAALALTLGSCSNMPEIDKEYNPLELDTDQGYFTGTLRKGDEPTDAKVVVYYEKGLGRTATAYIPETDGIYAEPKTLTLAEGSGSIEIPLAGAPTKGGTDITFKAIVDLGSHNLFQEFKVKPLNDIVLDGAGSTSEGNFIINQEVTDGVIKLSYESTKAYEVWISAAEVLGIKSEEAKYTLPAAPDGNGSVSIPVTGTPKNYGDITLAIRLVKENEEYSTNVKVGVKGELELNAADTYVDDDLVKGEDIDGQNLMLAYSVLGSNDLAATISIDEVSGISVAKYETTIPAVEDGFFAIPLEGKPRVDGIVTLTVDIEVDGILYSAELDIRVKSLEGGVEFEEETFTWNDLTYKTIFVDVNDNGYVNPGEVWLDRNLGATSNDPGGYGEGNGNQDSFGHSYQFGLPYGSSYTDPYTIDYDNMTPWNICPDGYRLPTRAEFAAAIQASIPGSTLSADKLKVTVPGGNAAKAILESPLKLPTVGRQSGNTAPEEVGIRGFYWTSEKGSNTAPWRIEFNSGDTTGQNWSGWNWQHPIRCIKDITD